MNKKDNNYSLISQNKKARFDYTIEDTVECGVILTGTEVKSLRLNKASINEAHADIKNRSVFLYNLHIPPYQFCHYKNHNPKRIRELLLHKKQINKISSQIKQKGMTIIPMSLYFNHKGIAKILVGIAKGKKIHDKRETIKRRESEREKRMAVKKIGRQC